MQGIIILFDEERRTSLLKDFSHDEDFTFSDTFSIDDWDIGQKQLALLCFTEGIIDYICIAKRGNIVATAKAKVEFTNIVELGGLRIDEIEENIKTSLKPHFIRSSRGLGQKIPERTWEDVLKVLIKLQKNKASDIYRLLSIIDMSGRKLRGKNAEILSLERDAMGMALDIFDPSNKLRKTVLSGWSPHLEGIDSDYNEGNIDKILGKDSFFSGLPQQYISEESALQHDLMHWGDFDAHHNAGRSFFTRGNRTLDIIYANQNSIEHTLGVDLVYINKKYNSFVLVQYKTMKSENGTPYYRPDSRMRSQLSRMNKFMENYCGDEKVSGHDDYRILDDGFLVKLVPNRGLTPASGELIKGMYLTRKYFEFLLSDNGPKGNNGGPIIKFDNAPRYLTNTDFSNFVNNGWLGTRGIQSDALKKFIQDFYVDGNAILIAQEEIIK